MAEEKSAIDELDDVVDDIIELIEKIAALLDEE
jgi:hypothetical protein